MPDIIEIAEIRIELVRKRVKNINLSVRPPDGAVRLTSPMRTNLAELRSFAESKLPWIRKKRVEMRAIAPVPRLGFVEGETHLVWGRPCLLVVEEARARPRVELVEGILRLRVRPGSDAARREAIVEGWYREETRRALGPLVERWSVSIGVRVGSVDVRRMKTRWGTCSPRQRLVRFNSELARRPLECLEYVVVHELAHLIEASHNARFKALLGRHLPDWKRRRDLLNRFPQNMCDSAQTSK